MDFFQVRERSTKRENIEVYPAFRVGHITDLMIRGGKFYAIWDEEAGLWSTKERDVQRLVDRELYDHRNKMASTEGIISVRSMSDFSSKSWLEFKTYTSKIPDEYTPLDPSLTFSNTKVRKVDYASKRLPYPLETGSFAAYDELIGTLYDPEERAKLEWAMGAVVSGDSRDIQKFVVLYGEAGAGKSTILNIIQKLFEGYYTTFEAKALASSNNQFSTEVFKSNPLVGIQHDGDLSKIEDNSKLNSIISHEEMTMNEKYKSGYTDKLNCFLFMATNKPVKITDAKSGIIRRLIDVKPSGRKLPSTRYHELMSQIDFELGAIASHCLEVYKEMGKNYYASYRPLGMMFKTDAFFNFVEASYDEFQSEDGINLKRAYDMYKHYCEDGLVEFKLPMYKFREELKNYFSEFCDVIRIEGKMIRSYYKGFLSKLFEQAPVEKKVEAPAYALKLDHTVSILDDVLADCLAQYASDKKKPVKAWADVMSRLRDLVTTRLHYVKVPGNHIVIDFDLRDESGNKSAALNLEAASKWPPTYAEYSNSGAGIHLHYIYDGDVSKLSCVFSDGIEVKTPIGGSSIRRRLSKCNDLPIATINSGLPLKEEKVVDFVSIKSERSLRTQIKRNLHKEIHPSTKSSMDFIKKILNDAYASGLKYDVSDMRAWIFEFASNSTNNATYCMEMVDELKFKSEEPSPPKLEYNYDELVFFDVEVFPNLFLVNWKFPGPDAKVVRMINPSPKEIEDLMRFKLVGFNCRKYDNHMLYGRYIGYDNLQLYNLSKRIIHKSKEIKNVFFGAAYNISYTDIYDFASAANKKSLKKFEIELRIHHQELGLHWDRPVPAELWEKVAEYCDNDVVATEAVFNYLKGDWVARQILAELSGLTVNDTTNEHSKRIVFGDDKKPQSQFVYTDLSTIFPGYEFKFGKSWYRGEDPKEGGYVYAEPGMYWNVAVLDVASMHPTSIEQLNLFGPYTQVYSDLKSARLAIKHDDVEALGRLLGGRLVPFYWRAKNGEFKLSDLSTALKTALNSAYGLTSAKFENQFRDPRNVDNIVAKRGALFMIDLKHAVQEQGFQVIHIKTDSIKIPNATTEIIKFVLDFGKKYGYEFEHEESYDRICLVNNAVYIAKYMGAESCDSLYGYVPKKCKSDGGKWTATGAQFAQPYVFKTLFSKEAVEFDDLCETMSVTSAFYLDMNEHLPDVTAYEKELDRLRKKIKEGSVPDNEVNRSHILELEELIATGHDYQFVGKTGLFCPVLPGCGGGLLVRENDGKYAAATGTKGYRWLEAEVLTSSGKEDAVDPRYAISLADEAKASISDYGDFEMFVSDGTHDLPAPAVEEEPKHVLPCGEDTYDLCINCPKFRMSDSSWEPTCDAGIDLTGHEDKVYPF